MNRLLYLVVTRLNKEQATFRVASWMLKHLIAIASPFCIFSKKIRFAIKSPPVQLSAGGVGGREARTQGLAPK